MWCSKQDVINDELDVLGYSPCDFDESHVVQGLNKPPRPHREHLDEETLMRLEDNQSSSNDQPMAPDLQAITASLRMIDTFDKPEKKETSPEIEDTSQSTFLVISKLNPNVQEFTPKFNGIQQRQAQVPSLPACKEDMLPENVDEKPVGSTSDKDPPNNLKTETLEEHLKKKITSSNKHATLEQKRQRNVAIAALMRLKTTPSTPTPSSTPKSNSPQPKTESTDKLAKFIPPESSLTNGCQKPVELLTPEYFQGPSRAPKVLNFDENEKTIPELKTVLDPPESSPSSNEIVDSSVEESIAKVNDWLYPGKSERVKSGPAVPHLNGVVSFKRKERATVSPKSPCSDGSKQSDVENIPPPPQKYVPSKYAEELSKKLKERVKAKEEPPNNLKKLEDIGFKLTFSRRTCDNGQGS